MEASKVMFNSEMIDEDAKKVLINPGYPYITMPIQVFEQFKDDLYT